jgi:hypothetical protein
VDGHVLQSGISGYDIDTYLCQYDAGGMLISSTLLSSNHYNKRDTIIVRIEGAQQPPVAPIA